MIDLISIACLIVAGFIVSRLDRKHLVNPRDRKRRRRDG